MFSKIMLLYLTPETTVEDGDNMLFAGVQSRYAKAPWRGYDVGDPNPLSDWVGSPAAENGPPTTISCVPCSPSSFCLVIMGHFFCIRDIVNIKVILLENEGPVFVFCDIINLSNE